MEEEIWKEAAAFPDYQVSNYGRVRSNKKGRIKMLKPATTRDGYQIVNLSQYHTTYCRSVHTIVANTFLRKPSGGIFYVRHLNGNRSDNRVSNLRWESKKLTYTGKRVYLYDDVWEFIAEFKNATEAAYALGGSAGSIRNVCNGIGETYLGYRWSYYDPKVREDMEVQRDYDDCGRAVYQYEGTPGNEVWVNTWDNYAIAGEALGINPDGILRCCRGTQKRAGGYAWDFADKYYNKEDFE